MATTTKVYEIDFGGHLKTKIHVIDNEIMVEAAVNGWGYGVSLTDIEITELSLKTMRNGS